jgi:hypothetical protein
METLPVGKIRRRNTLVPEKSRRALDVARALLSGLNWSLALKWAEAGADLAKAARASITPDLCERSPAGEVAVFPPRSPASLVALDPIHSHPQGYRAHLLPGCPRGRPQQTNQVIPGEQISHHRIRGGCRARHHKPPHHADQMIRPFHSITSTASASKVCGNDEAECLILVPD